MENPFDISAVLLDQETKKKLSKYIQLLRVFFIFLNIMTDLMRIFKSCKFDALNLLGFLVYLFCLLP